MITTEKHLLYILKVSRQQLDSIIENIDKYYSTWEKPKLNKDTNEPLYNSDGTIKKRTINSTNKDLKVIQKRLYNYLLSKTTLPNYFFGGTPKKDNILNAKYHQGNKYVFTTDLKSFFPSINHKMVFYMFLKLGCTPEIARTLTKLTTHNYQVPQGVPTSTLIANLVFKPVGDRIQALAKENNIKFSIFVDDITMSSSIDFHKKIPEILSIITTSGYKISHSKTFYKTKNPIVTGVICQNNKLKIPQSYNKRIKRIKADVQNNEQAFLKIKGLTMYRQRIKQA